MGWGFGGGGGGVACIRLPDTTLTIHINKFKTKNTHRHLPGGVLYDLYGPQHPPQREGDLFGSDDEAEGASASASAAASAAALKRGGGGGEGGIVTPWRVTVRFHDIPLDRVGRSIWLGVDKWAATGEKETGIACACMSIPIDILPPLFIRHNIEKKNKVLELPVDPSGAREAAMRHFRGRLKQVCRVGVGVC